ncbi:MoaD/ThiS family protein [Desulfurococcus mucosus]|uniref:ThiamineS protein n=1 Tax=Desulfurococcus mucosus (strain ATCC 35584 / DSM 2162 / JCM 9187 / O7/1) TaxID=765177 RepID=E8R8L1_DESM0|nr:MoaD/ThiS family protein [Desulfurococcus mucosus]ADV64837.1 thiamineS protein [Desulfurococcus mucosus DSM 2162]
MTLRVKVLLLGVLADAAGTHMEEHALKDGSRVSELIEAVVKRHSGLKALVETLPVLNIYVNGRHVDLNHALGDGDEVVIAPPFYEGG